MIYAPNLNQTHELDLAIALDNRAEDLRLMPSLCAHTSCETSRPLSSTLSDVGMCVTLLIGPRALISSREHSLLFRCHSFFGTSSL